MRAEIPATNTVCLWLGANCMVEYTFEEAISLLSKNLEAASGNLATTETDIAYLRDQINTTDVNMSQVYNVRRFVDTFLLARAPSFLFLAGMWNASLTRFVIFFG